MKKTIKVDYLARVEGEGGLHLDVRDGRVTEARLNIFESPRFFEALLCGRSFREAPDITARICGICPVAYMMSATHAMENAAGVQLDAGLRALRRLLYCGEWIESHVLHIVMLHAPDFLGYPDAIAMASDYPDQVQTGLQLKKLGNEIVSLLGGREVHPVNVKVGGFYKLPPRKRMLELRDKLAIARDHACSLLQWVSTFPYLDFERDYDFVSLKHPGEYPFNEGRVVSSSGLAIDAAAYEDHFREVHVPHSNALHSVLREGGTYHVGPMARFHHNREQLSDLARDAAAQAGLGDGCRNPFRSIQVRAVEVIYAFDEAVRILDAGVAPPAPCAEVQPRSARGCAATEAPRGLLYHRYDVDADGNISSATIVPPTSQNQKMMELDLVDLVPRYLHLEEQQLQWHCEQAIRNYDPCISCATHFLKLKVDRV